MFARSRIMELVDPLDERQMRTRTELGAGSWSVKDLLGHLAGYEEQATALATGKKPRFDFSSFGSVDERNAADIERKRNWSVQRVSADLEAMRSRLIAAIDSMDDEGWVTRVPTRTGTSALALLLGKLLVGGRHGFFAHDLAHLNDLKKSVKLITSVR